MNFPPPETVFKFARQGRLVVECKLERLHELMREEIVRVEDDYWVEGMARWEKVSELQSKLAEKLREEAATRTSRAQSESGMILVTTTSSAEGYRVRQYLGIALGVVVRTPNIIEGVGGSVGMALGGRVAAWGSMCEKTRKEAHDALIQSAKSMGANAVIGLAYNSNPVMESCTEVLCYGSAVVLEPA